MSISERKKRIAVFASGSGSNFEAIMTNINEGKIQGGEVVQLVCDKPGAFVIERAKKYGVPSFVFKAKSYNSKEEYEQEILKVLRDQQVDFIVLAGYMRLVGGVLLSEYRGRIINLHPSLLPAFTGKDAAGQAYEYGVKITGITIHLVDEGLDTGPIIAQKSIVIHEGESKESIEERIHQEEHQLLPRVIQWLIDDKIKVAGRKVQVMTDEKGDL